MSDEKEAYVIGIDEAGRGPVLGPMVYGMCYCPISKKEALKKLGFADSKKLTAEQRERLFDVVKDTSWLGWQVDVITAEDLSAKMLRRLKYSLNAISHDSAMGLIQAVLDKGILVQEVYIDTVGKEDTYTQKLQAAFPGIQFTVAKKADSLFPVVSAASICAKVTRDLSLTEWTFEEETKAGLELSRNLGSGYPGDEKTKAWLQRHLDPVFGWPGLVRFSWQTCKEILEKKGVAFKWDDDDDDTKDTPTLTSFWNVVPKAAGGAGGSSSSSSADDGASAAAPAPANPFQAARSGGRKAAAAAAHKDSVAVTSFVVTTPEDEAKQRKPREEGEEEGRRESTSTARLSSGSAAAAVRPIPLIHRHAFFQTRQMSLVTAF